ncbi:hypothetical protein HRR87_004091 [Exophiala dermatitidis]|nr:hypothetical protein HRR87_004091 [Exophiala dermatitidis]
MQLRPQRKKCAAATQAHHCTTTALHYWHWQGQLFPHSPVNWLHTTHCIPSRSPSRSVFHPSSFLPSPSSIRVHPSAVFLLAILLSLSSLPYKSHLEYLAAARRVAGAPVVAILGHSQRSSHWVISDPGPRLPLEPRLLAVSLITTISHRTIVAGYAFGAASPSHPPPRLPGSLEIWLLVANLRLCRPSSCASRATVVRILGLRSIFSPC